MSTTDDEFDIDLRLSLSAHDREVVPVGVGHLFPRAHNNDDTAAQQTCAVDTCDLGCQTQTCPEETCGCNTAETCNQQLEDCGGLLTFGPYCEDASGGEDTCSGCQAPGSEVCPDPPDV